MLHKTAVPYHNIPHHTIIHQPYQTKLQEPDPRAYVPDLVEMDTTLDPSHFIANFFNLGLWRAAECPGGNVHASARGLARCGLLLVLEILPDHFYT